MIILNCFTTAIKVYKKLNIIARFWERLSFDTSIEDLDSFSVLYIVVDKKLFPWEVTFKIKMKDYTNDFIQQPHLYTSFLGLMYYIKQMSQILNMLV